MSSATKMLACVYTCNEHRPFLDRFYASEVGTHLLSRENTQVVEVYADPSLSSPRLVRNELFLSVEERYERLSIKTHAMIDYCIRHFEFARLLKIDVTTVMTNMDSPEYEGRKPLDLSALTRFLRDADEGLDYNGFILHSAAGREGAESWARKKRGSIDYERLFGQGPMPPFYSGKCYLLSHSFATYVANSGAAVAEENCRYFLGAEDLMIGRLHERFRASQHA